jgi:tetratricopeptide (TPR) repeat protein
MKKILFALGVILIYGSVQAEQENGDIWAKSYALEANGRYKEAAGVIEPFIQGNSENIEFALLRYGWLNYLLRNHNVAIRNYEKALQLNNDSIDARLGLTLPLLAQQRWKESARHAKQILLRSPWNYTAHERLLISEEAQREWGTMKQHASELVARYPTVTTFWLSLARAEAWLGNNLAAKQAYARILIRLPEHLEATRYIMGISNNEPLISQKLDE